jgi:hypothetical protein
MEESGEFQSPDQTTEFSDLVHQYLLGDNALPADTDGERDQDRDRRNVPRAHCARDPYTLPFQE